MEYQILNEKDVKGLLTIDLALAAIDECFTEKSQGKFTDLPKYDIEGINGSLRITPGESQSISKVIGFRLYDVIRNDYSNQEQVVVVYDNASGKLKGIIVSQLLGAYRTAAINSIIHNKFKKDELNVLGMVGIGFQAQIHVRMFHQLLKPNSIKVYARNKNKAIQFQSTLRNDHNIDIELVNSIEGLYSNSDSLLLATNSKIPILENYKFKSGVTITTIGPKSLGASEVATEFSNSCNLIVTDSINQVNKYANSFFISPEKVHDYSELLKSNEAFRKEQNDIILICSVGMGGTEVVLGEKLLLKKQVIATKH